MTNTQKTSLKIMLGLLAAVLLFHLSVLTRIIPYTIVWAGKLNNNKEMYAFESVSILLTSLLITTLLVKGNYVKLKISNKIINAILWIHVLLFSLNTIGNLTAKTFFEKAVFTPLTFVSAILIWLIVRTIKEK